MKNIILIISILLLTVSCSKEDKKLSVETNGYMIKDNGKELAFVRYIKVHSKARKPFGPIIVLLKDNKSLPCDHSLSVDNSSLDSTKFYATFEGKKVSLSESTCIIYNPHDKTYKTYDLNKIDSDHKKFIEEKVKEANKTDFPDSADASPEI